MWAEEGGNTDGVLSLRQQHMYLVQDLSALLGIFSDPFSSPPHSYPGHMVVIWGKNQGLPFPKQYRIFPFAAQFLHPTLSRLWSGIAQSHLSLLSAISLLPGDIEWVGKHCRCIRTVYCSSEFLVFWDNFDLFILLLVFFDIWDLNKRHCPIFFLCSLSPNVITKGKMRA